MSSWIKISERFPENDTDVLIYNQKDGISTGYFNSSRLEGYYEIDGSFFITNSGWETNYSWAPHSSPTHWMPLPEIPNV